MDVYKTIPTKTKGPNDYNKKRHHLDKNNRPEGEYLPDSFFNSGTRQDQVYEIIVNASISPSSPTKRDFILKEILNTEERFVDALNTLINDFKRPLASCLSENDLDCIFINIEMLLNLHTKLKEMLAQSCLGGLGRTRRICSALQSFKVIFSCLFFD
jgi:hypothetical protein